MNGKTSQLESIQESLDSYIRCLPLSYLNPEADDEDSALPSKIKDEKPSDGDGDGATFLSFLNKKEEEEEEEEKPNRGAKEFSAPSNGNRPESNADAMQLSASNDDGRVAVSEAANALATEISKNKDRQMAETGTTENDVTSTQRNSNQQKSKKKTKDIENAKTQDEITAALESVTTLDPNDRAPYVSRLKELGDREHIIPIYQETRLRDNLPFFQVSVKYAMIEGIGGGRNKKEARQAAAKAALDKLAQLTGWKQT